MNGKIFGHNPIKMSKDLSKNVLEVAAKDPAFLRSYQAVLSRFHETMDLKRRLVYRKIKDIGSLPIAYFSAEYGPHHCLPFYAGGLGFLAGDHLKECSDLDVPLVAM
jgi:glycogen phosphorylase